MQAEPAEQDARAQQLAELAVPGQRPAFPRPAAQPLRGEREAQEVEPPEGAQKQPAQMELELERELALAARAAELVAQPLIGQHWGEQSPLAAEAPLQVAAEAQGGRPLPSVA
jgi:hypothetical protein